MTNRMIWQKASFYLIWKCAVWVASDMEPRCDQHSRGNWGHQLIKPSRVVKGKPPFFPVLFFYQDPLIIQLPLFMNTSLRARRKAIRRLCVGKSVKVCVYQTMLGTACDRLCPAHQGKTSYRCLVAYNRAEVGWGKLCANAIHLRQASTGTISTSSHAWESLTAPFVPLVTWQFLNLIFSPFGSCLTVPSPDNPSKLQRSETHPLGVVFKHLTSLWKCWINPTHKHPSLFDGKPVKYLDEVAVICSWNFQVPSSKLEAAWECSKCVIG